MNEQRLITFRQLRKHCEMRTCRDSCVSRKNKSVKAFAAAKCKEEFCPIFNRLKKIKNEVEK